MQQQKIIKLVHIYHQNYDKNKSGTHFYGKTMYMHTDIAQKKHKNLYLRKLNPRKKIHTLYHSKV